MKRSELVRRLEAIEGFSSPRADWEQVVTPSECAADLVAAATVRGDIAGRTVIDLGSGTGRLAFAAAFLGASAVVGVDRDDRAIERARATAGSLHLPVRFVVAEVDAFSEPADTVVMNPPFGAQRRDADVPFWTKAFELAGRAVYAFAPFEARAYVAARAREAGFRVVEIVPVRWELPRTFPHHRKERVRLPVDRWSMERRENE